MQKHKFVTRNSVRRCRVCGLLETLGINNPGGNCPGTDDMAKALKKALSPSGEITLGVDSCDTWQERLGGRIQFEEPTMSVMSDVVAVELALDGSFLLWRTGTAIGIGVGISDVCDKCGSHPERVVKMRDDTVLARIIDGQIWFQLPTE